MKVKELKEVIKDLPNDMEILAGAEGLIDVKLVAVTKETLVWTDAFDSIEELMKYTGKTPEEFEEDYLYIELGGV
ncbi:hypothetical protein [Lactococcus lactis]|jgi:hypothetical protein|uniref:hypothetical protein n=1 Tax=Lactococcus lactis TaxID=1358 RepID=UPI002052EEBC|nr:hypothetical protein [Lactococcus lactis]WKF72869.1 hypothetical protein QYM42_10890 [Lactococcus lactis]BDH82385.1 hypothetical protein LLL8_20420 [Lactococcus lactis]